MNDNIPVFISHSLEDKALADAICQALEANGIPCWIAPRNIRLGKDWSEAIVEAISNCKVLVLVFTAKSNESIQVRREVQRAFERGVRVIPIRVENVLPSSALEYYISSVHWLDAASGLNAVHLELLTTQVRALLSSVSPDSPERLPSPRLPVPVIAQTQEPPAADAEQNPGAKTPHNLPQMDTSFVGREQVLADLSEQMRSGRLITLTGPGGIGKTRIAIQAATDNLNDFPDGVWLVELGHLTDAKDVPAAMALALGLQPGEDDSKTGEQVFALLKNRCSLLILDTFEQIIEAARFVGDLLNKCTQVVCLVTSRQLLQIAREREFPVTPMELPADGMTVEHALEVDSVRLFVERARRVRPDFTLTDENVPAVNQICRQMEGIPLAIELTATLVRGIMPREILPRLTSRFDLLASNRRDLEPRQRSLRGAMDWSYGLLDEAERELFAQLSVFSGGCCLEDVEKVSTTFDVMNLVLDLRDKSLLRVHMERGETRYSMLETLREYAQEKLIEQGTQDIIRKRHADHFLEKAKRLGEQIEQGDTGEARERLDLELDNIRAGMDWAMQQQEKAMLAGYGLSLGRFLSVASALP